MSQQGITLYHIKNTRSLRILWLLEELGLSYEVKEYERGADFFAPEELKKVHPLGKIPILIDGEDTIAESGTIVEYLISKYGGENLKPKNSEWLDNTYFTHYSEGTLMPLLVNRFIFSVVPSRTPFLARPIASLFCSTFIYFFLSPRLVVQREFVESHLAKSTTGWFANSSEPKSADFMMFFPLEFLQSSESGTNSGSEIDKYIQRVHERPAYKRAIEKGGRIDYAAYM